MKHFKSIPRKASLTDKLAFTGKCQRGISLMMALIALVAMSLTAMALIRSVDTGNVIAGNVAFRQASVQAVDVGMEAAYNALQSMAKASLDTNSPAGCTTACQYYATTRAVDPTYDIVKASDASAAPATWVDIDWTTVPVPTTLGGAYNVQYVIDRLCNVATVTETNKTSQCYVTKLDPKCGSHGPDVPPCNITQGIYYRATIRITGPRNTLSFAQASLIRY